MDGSFSAQKTFLLGLGCEKGGTTWLYDYLAAHHQVPRGLAKEYHVHNVHFIESFREWQDARIRKTRALIEALGRVPGRRRQKRIADLEALLAQRETLAGMAADLDRYVDYFVELAHGRACTRLVCDITPLYACLDAEALTRVRARLEDAGFDVRVIFIMRDPIERAFSDYRMGMSRAEDYSGWLLAPKLGALQREAETWLRLRSTRLRQAMARTPEAKARSSPFLQEALSEIPRHCSSYERTIAAAEDAFDDRQIHYAFFETFFRDDAIRRVTDFLGIEFVPGAYGVRRNKSAVESQMSGFEIEALRDAFAGTYDFCARRFGADFIKRIWQHY